MLLSPCGGKVCRTLNEQAWLGLGPRWCSQTRWPVGGTSRDPNSLPCKTGLILASIACSETQGSVRVAGSRCCLSSQTQCLSGGHREGRACTGVWGQVALDRPGTRVLVTSRGEGSQLSLVGALLDFFAKCSAVPGTSPSCRWGNRGPDR